MPFEISWQHENRVILGRYYGVMSLDDLVNWDTSVAQYLNTGTPPIHLILDVSEVTKFPTNVLQLRNHLNNLSHPSKGWTLLVGSSSLINSLTTIVTQLAHSKFRPFKTTSAALDFLAKEDITLNSLA